MADDKLRNAVLSRLQSSTAGMTTRRLARLLRRPSREVNRELLDLQNAGLVKFKQTKWTATFRAPPPSARPPRPPSPPVRPSVLPGQATAQVTPETPEKFTPPQESVRKGRWQTFRRLCEYYAECVRLDQGTTIHSKANEENQKFVYLPSVTGQAHGTEGWRRFPVQESWSPFVRKLKSASYAFLGCPIERFHWKDKQSDAEQIYCSPVFLWQVEYRIEGQWLLVRL